ALEQLVERALCKRPSDRYQSMSQLLIDLDRVRRALADTTLAGHAALLASRPRRWAARRRRAGWLLGAGALAVAASVGAWTLARWRVGRAPAITSASEVASGVVPATAGSQARELFERGRRALLSYYREENIDEATAWFRQAQQRDPRLAVAYAGSAEAL